MTTQLQRIDCRVTRQPAVRLSHSKHTTLYDADSSTGRAGRFTIRSLENSSVADEGGDIKGDERRRFLLGSLILRSRHPEKSSRFAWPFDPHVKTPSLALSVLTGQYLSRYDRNKFMRWAMDQNNGCSAACHSLQ